MTSAIAEDEAGVLYVGGQIRTFDPSAPQAEAVATREGRIVAVGAERDCRATLGFDPATGDDSTVPLRAAGGPPGVVVDLDGQTLLPGFNDVHLHPVAACFAAYHVDLSGATSIAGVLDPLADRARETTPGEWVVGVRLTADQLDERRLPTLAELDALGRGRPVVVLLRDGHTSLGNSVALATAGIRADRATPPAGRYGLDESGRLSGVCHESATGTLMSAVTLPGLDQLWPVAKQLLADWNAQGLTSLGVVLQTDDEGLAGPSGALESVGMMILTEELAQGTHAILGGSPTNAIDLRTSSLLHQPAANRVVGGIKLFLDGTLGGRTAALRQPYADAPDTSGMFTTSRSDALRRMEAGHLAGLQICVHAIGDAANVRALELFGELLARHPPDPSHQLRHRVEHASVLDQATAEGFAALGIVVAVQPPSVTHEASWVADRVGVERSAQVYPYRTLTEAGVVLAGSSDAPLESSDVLAGIGAAVTRAGFEPAEALTAEEAVALYTRNAAVAQRRDHLTGTLTEGKRADLVVLSDDPMEVPPDRIADIEVRRTVIGGSVVHSTPTTNRATGRPAGGAGR